MLLDTEHVRIEGPAGVVHAAIYVGILSTLRHYGMGEQEADRVAQRALVRIEAQLGRCGYVIRQIADTD